MYIYKILNKTNGKFYIGQTLQTPPEKRWRQHKSDLRSGRHHCEPLQRAWIKYGETAFDFDIVHTVTSQEELDLLEETLISNCNEVYNIRGGGRGKGKLAESTKLKISKANSGRKMTDYTRQRIRDGNKNKIITQEYRDRMRELCTGSGNPFYGKHHSPEVKQVLREHNMGSNHPQYGKTRSVETKKKIGQSRRKYKIVPLVSPSGEVFADIENLQEFARIHKLDASSLSKLFSGKKKSHKGWTIHDGLSQ